MRRTRVVDELRERRLEGTGEVETGIFEFMSFLCDNGVVGCDDDILLSLINVLDIIFGVYVRLDGCFVCGLICSGEHKK